MKKNKAIYRILIILSFLLMNAGLLFGISQVIVYLNSGADPSSMLHLDLKPTTYYSPQVVWESIENPGRVLDNANKNKLELDYLDAWYVKNKAFETGYDDIIYDHFTQNARKKISDLIRFNAAENISVKATTLSHHITLEFYSVDGTVAVLTDKNVTGVEQVFENNQFILQQEFNNDYRIILLFEDGVWRVRHFEKIKVNEIEISKKQTLSFEGEIMEGINYYPQNSPWDTFNDAFDSAIIEEDFELISELRFNTVRVFVGYEDFGKAKVNKAKIEKLKALLDAAQKTNLKVMITLFDFYGDYDIKDWTLTNTHMTQVVDAVKNHEALYGWDIKNEPNLDFENRGQQRVLSWLSQTTKTIKQLDPNHPITIGWSSPEVAMLLEDEVDIVSYHYYEAIENLSEAHNALKNTTDKPIVLQEIGMSTYQGVWNPLGSDEEDQAAFYKTLLETQKRDSINYLSWTLYNFVEIPNSVAGYYPWRKNKQGYFGLIDFEGVKNKSFSVIKNR